MSGTPTTATTFDWTAIQRRALLVCLAGVICCVIGALLNWQHFLRSWLVAWTFWNGISLGSLVLLMIQYITGGAWGLLLRRIFEAAASNVALMAILFLVLLADLPVVYEWANPAAVAESPVLQHKQAYLNQHAFMMRAAIYLVLWVMLAWLVKAWSQKQDRIASDGSLGDRCRTLSGPGLVIYGITVTFASIDWIMSLEPEWYSTIFPPLYATGQLLSALAFSIAVFMLLADRPPFVRVLTTQRRRDLGNLLLAFIMLWAYLSFSQFMIIWSENLPEETSWYMRRLRGGWQYLALLLILFQFALPFLLLLA